MIRLLSAVGRVVVVVGAVVTVIAFTVEGYWFGRVQEAIIYSNYEISGGGQITPLKLLYAVVGCGIGIVVAGSVFGAIATLYDIRDSLRQLTRLTRGDAPLNNTGDQSVIERARREPRIG